MHHNDPMWQCPETIKESLALYVEQRVPTGSFLLAVLENDLRDAIAKADHVNVRCLPGIVTHIYNELPAVCWGSRERVRAWLTGEEG